MKKFILRILLLLLVMILFVSQTTVWVWAANSSINQQDFNGDVCFFDNRFCYISDVPKYNRFDMFPKTNVITATRLLNYKSPNRTDYIYLKRIGNDDDCFFNVNLTMPAFAHANGFKHRYLKMEGDFKADTLQDIDFLIRDNHTGTSYDTHIAVRADGAVSGAAKIFPDAVKQGEWFHLLWAINIDTHSYDIYLNGEKIISNSLNKNITQFDILRVNLCESSVVGDLYVDNFNVTGLIKPIVDGVETKTPVIANDDAVKAFLSDKIGMHAYGNTLHKNGIKTLLEEKGIYDEKTEQYYVTTDTLNTAFDLNLTEKNGEITGSISIKSDGTVSGDNINAFELDFKPIIKNSRLYVPVRQIAAEALGKYVWSFKTGILLFSEQEINIDSTDWVWQSARDTSSATGCTVWNDIDYLNGYLQYVRPDAERLKQDYIAKTGDTDFTQHPRIYHNADEFRAMREKYEANVDPLFTKTVNEYIKTADKYLEEPLIDYTDWLDSMRHMAGRDITSRFLAWGVAYQMTGDKKYVDAAAKQFEIASTFPDFNTAHVIDAGESAAGLAVGYDWFYNAFTPEQRAVALKTVREVCLDMLASGLYGRLSSASGGASEWRSFKLMNNYNAIVNAGITLASIATLEHDTDTAFQYISDSLRSIEYTMQMFPPGGAWTEGPNYLNFTLQSIVPWALNMENNFGQSYNIMDGQGMDGVVDFMVASTGTEGTNNMGDSEKTPALSYESYFYFAKRYNRPYASYMRWHDINSGNTLGSFYDLMYWDFEAGKIDQTALADLPKTQRVDGMELFSIRDSYADSEANFYFSAHFGTTTGYHQHWDCGTFVLDFLGERWAYDLGMDNYNLQNELGYQGYEIFRKRGEAHNMLLLNPTKYTDGVETVLREFAPIIDAQSNENGGFVYADLSDVYEDASKMLLGYYIDDNMNSVTMRNEFTLNKASSCMWTMNTKGQITIDGNVAYVVRNGKAIKLEVLCSGTNVRWQDNGNPKPLKETIPAEKFAKQNQNMGYKQLRLLFDAPQGENKLVIKISSKYGNISDINDTPISDWTLNQTNFITVTETKKKIFANTRLDNSLLIRAQYSDKNELLNIEYIQDKGHTTEAFEKNYNKTKFFVLDSFSSIRPLTKSVSYVPSYSEETQKAPIVIDFTNDMAGITAENPDKLKLSLEDGRLKCVSDFDDGYASYLYLPLDDIDGEYYNRFKITAMVESAQKIETAKIHPQSFSVYYSGTSKLDDVFYGESSDRRRYIPYEGLIEQNGWHKNTGNREYIRELNTLSKWSECNIHRLRIDVLDNALGTVYIDKIEIYHE